MYGHPSGEESHYCGGRGRSQKRRRQQEFSLTLQFSLVLGVVDFELGDLDELHMVTWSHIEALILFVQM